MKGCGSAHRFGPTLGPTLSAEREDMVGPPVREHLSSVFAPLPAYPAAPNPARSEGLHGTWRSCVGSTALRC